MTNELYKEMFSYEIGTPQHYRNFEVYPLISKTPGKSFPFHTLRSIKKKNLVKLTEVNKSGQVRQVKIKNFSNKDILIPMGQSIIGAKQNRMVIQTSLIRRFSKTIIPVRCTEVGRWKYNPARYYGDHQGNNRMKAGHPSTHFSTDHTDAPLFLLSCVNRLKNEGNGTYNDQYSMQKEIWDKIRLEQMYARVYSKTKSLTALLDKVRNEEEEMQIEIPQKMENQEGIIVSRNGSILAMQIFRNADVYAFHHESSIRSLCITGDSKLPDNKMSINDWYWLLASGWRMCRKAINKGNLHIFSTNGYSGEVLEHRNRLIHATFTCS